MVLVIIVITWHLFIFSMRERQENISYIIICIIGPIFYGQMCQFETYIIASTKEKPENNAQMSKSAVFKIEN